MGYGCWHGALFSNETLDHILVVNGAYGKGRQYSAYTV